SLNPNANRTRVALLAVSRHPNCTRPHGQIVRQSKNNLREAKSPYQPDIFRGNVIALVVGVYEVDDDVRRRLSRQQLQVSDEDHHPRILIESLIQQVVVVEYRKQISDVQN